ncbi:MFS transporter [Streptomyces sp. NBC_00083]|uniref:MFS transporter n=1 Tax=Streptomyces sp. NBC_00083 TaxID=2975647 RepID=UPI00225140AC|nr:MFS transporter [Streptomyces sp. NBC_00083]MCX5387506.1 MFS transporter [Streptomyces sp. NBC_00083]
MTASSTPTGKEPSSSAERTSTLRLLTGRPVRGLLTIAFLTRTTAATLPVLLLLALADAHGYARAATVGGTYTLVLALCAPLRGRLLDRCGPRTLLAMASATTLLLALVVASIHYTWPWPTTLPLVIAATLTSPPLNSALRSSWRRLAAGEAQLKAVHSADSVLEEAGFVLAPLIAGAALVLLGPRHGYETAAAGFVAVMALYLAAAHRHHLTPTRTPATAAAPRNRGRRWLGPLALPGMPAILLPLLIMGALFGGTGILVPAYTQHEHATNWLGPLLAATSTGGLLGGIAYAALPWRSDLWHKYRILTLGLTTPVLLLFLARPLWLLATLLMIAGVFVTPLFINAFLLTDATATDDMRIEANTWIGATADVANGIMATITGTLVQAQKWDTALLTLTCCAATGAAATLLQMSLHRARPAGSDAEEGETAPVATAQPTSAVDARPAQAPAVSGATDHHP